MPYYRLYYMNQSSGHIERFEEFDTADDVEAVRTVSPSAREQPLELWCENRKIQRFESTLLFQFVPRGLPTSNLRLRGGRFHDREDRTDVPSN